jgi:hypothetical protein
LINGVSAFSTYLKRLILPGKPEATLYPKSESGNNQGFKVFADNATRSQISTFPRKDFTLPRKVLLSVRRVLAALLGRVGRRVF